MSRVFGRSSCRTWMRLKNCVYYRCVINLQLFHQVLWFTVLCPCLPFTMFHSEHYLAYAGWVDDERPYAGWLNRTQTYIEYCVYPNNSGQCNLVSDGRRRGRRWGRWRRKCGGREEAWEGGREEKLVKREECIFLILLVHSC